MGVRRNSDGADLCWGRSLNVGGIIDLYIHRVPATSMGREFRPELCRCVDGDDQIEMKVGGPLSLSLSLLWLVVVARPRRLGRRD